MTLVHGDMKMLMRAILGAALLAAMGASPSRAQDLGVRPLRYGTTGGWYYDNRDDNRDFTGNGFFPGNFTADPPSAWLGAAGVLAGNSYRQPAPYPSQVVIDAQPSQAICGRSGHTRHRTFVGSDGVRHRC